ncbi:unnamed protein product [Rotaria socialis]
MNPYGILSLTLQPKEMLRISDAVTVAAINYYELGENYQRQNQTAKALIFFCKSFQLKRKFYERFDNDDLRRTFSKIIETSISTEEIEKHIYSKKKSLLDGDRIMAYFHSNSAWRAYKEQNYSLAKKLFTEALDFYQGLPGNVDNRQAAMQYLQEIDNKLQVPLKKLILQSVGSWNILPERNFSSSVDSCWFQRIQIYPEECLGNCWISDWESPRIVLFTLGRTGVGKSIFLSSFFAYPTKLLIEWYRDDSGLCGIANRALRLKNYALLHNLCLFITDLYRELQIPYKQQKLDEVDSKQLIVYRGRKMSRDELNRLNYKIGQSVFNSSFRSTTLNQYVAHIFAAADSNTTESVALVLDMEINTSHETSQCNRRQKHLIIERYHNNTHRIKKHLLSLDLFFRTLPDNQSNTVMCQELCYYLFMDHFKDSGCFCNVYPTKPPIEWYRGDSGLCSIANRALRLKNYALLHNLRLFLTDLYQELQKLHKQQKLDEEDSMLLRRYRGQKMSRDELNGLINNIGQLVFNNSFFSTTSTHSVAHIYAAADSNTTESVAVLFDMEINTSHVTRYYGCIHGSGEEDELIIAPGAIFRLQNVECISNSHTMRNTILSDIKKDELWLIKLSSIDEKHLLGETLTILSETNMIGAGDPVVTGLVFIF